MRYPVVAGEFYPAHVAELKKMISQFLENAPKFDEKFQGFVVPHAGYIYSGQVAAAAYANVSCGIRKVMILAPSHYGRFEGASVNSEDYETPLGVVKVDRKIVSGLLNNGLRTLYPAHMQEHSIEVQLPFLQSVLKNFKLIPVILGEMNYEVLAKILEKYVEEETLILASSDLSHYYPYDVAVKKDKECVDAITYLDVQKLRKKEACGSAAIEVLLWIARNRGWKAKLLDYKNSGDTAGSKDKVVGYCAVGFY